MQRCVGAVAAGKGKERRAGRGCATVLALCPPARGRVHGIGHTEVWPPARLRAARRRRARSFEHARVTCACACVGLDGGC